MTGETAIDKGTFILGRKEWIALPGLGLAAIRAKIDTGARTSALHASGIETFGSGHALRVRFRVQPLPLSPRLIVECEAPVKDMREITSSNGGVEKRYIIETMLAVGGRQWAIELGLTDRSQMTYRMLLGRQALPPDVLVDPSTSYHQPRLSPKLYRTDKPRKS